MLRLSIYQKTRHNQLNGGDWDGFLVSALGGGMGMWVRQLLTHRQVNPLINFCITAFVATSVS
ncbi:hypothetical protein E4V28_17250, partial [Proteus mirabilis]